MEEGSGDHVVAVNVTVAVRCRPMSGKEIAQGSETVVEFPRPSQVAVAERLDRHEYAFDHVFAPEAPQERIYEVLGAPLLDKAFEGYNSAIFAYGQTGSGKTHTMLNHLAPSEDRGLVPRLADALFHHVARLVERHQARRFLVCCSFLEIYNELIYDLLVPRSSQPKGGLEVKEQKGLGVYVRDLTEMVVESSERLNGIIERGLSLRSTAATKMNDTSSRSHCVFTIKLHQKDANDSSKNTFCKLNLVDLAGSERAKRTEAEGSRLREGANINKSLSALGNVINALSTAAATRAKVFVPYRNSKLTRVLQESLGGNSLCTMVAAISPSGANVEETLSTLNYARRAKLIKVVATKNDEAEQVRRLREEVDALRCKLEDQAAEAQTSVNEKQVIETRYAAQIRELQSFLEQSWEQKQRLSKQHEQEQRKAREEAARAADRARSERQRRLKLLEQKDDIKASFEALGWGDEAADVVALEQSLRSQVRAVQTYRESARADFAMCVGCELAGPGALLALLVQMERKLQSMTEELRKLGELEAGFEEGMGRVAPKLAAAVRTVRERSDRPVGPSREGQCLDEESRELLEFVQRQLGEYHKKTHLFLRGERGKMDFQKEADWLLGCLDTKKPSSPEVEELIRALRTEVAGTDSGASPAVSSAPHRGSHGGLEASTSAVCGGVSEVRRRLEERQQAQRKEDEAKAAEAAALKDRAEQERDVLEKRLQEQLRRVAELEAECSTSQELASTAETQTLQTRVEIDRLRLRGEQFRSALEAASEAVVLTAEQRSLKEEHNRELQNWIEDLTAHLQVVAEERDLARTKEEETHEELVGKDAELLNTNRGYVQLTERQQELEEEIANLRDEEEEWEVQNTRLEKRCGELQDELFDLCVSELPAIRSKIKELERVTKVFESRRASATSTSASASA